MLPWSVMATDFLAQGGDAFGELGEVAGSVEEGVFGVEMEVGELGHG